MLYWPAGGVCDVSDCVINARTRSQNAVGSSLVAAPPEAACPEMSRRELEEEVSFFRNKKNKTDFKVMVRCSITSFQGGFLQLK